MEPLAAPQKIYTFRHNLAMLGFVQVVSYFLTVRFVAFVKPLYSEISNDGLPDAFSLPLSEVRDFQQRLSAPNLPWRDGRLTAGIKLHW